MSFCAAAFPPMMLLSLVENAIKHGLNPLRGGGSIRIVAASDDGDIAHHCGGHWRRPSQLRNYGGGNGVGLSNIRSRLAALYGGRGAADAWCATRRTASSQPSKCHCASMRDGARMANASSVSQTARRFARPGAAA